MNQPQNASATHIKYMTSDLIGTPKPDLAQLTKQIFAENAKIGANGAMQRATEIVRQWAVVNGFAK
ncbi:MAG: hypothetical protein FJ267_17505 [Planctomycetes bacterium]|nr:hypothetical protein [Planctomycetota bacterium]